MSAKFIAQIEISKPCVSSASRPAEATRPRIVSSSGSPAATSEPNASTRIAIVTGQERSSDFSIALRLAVLKSLHIPEAPVSETGTAAVPASLSFDLSVSAAATIVVGSPLAPAITTAVCRSAEILEPACGGTIDRTWEFARRTRSTRATVWRKPASLVVSCREWTTIISAELERPAKFRWMSVRAWTDSEPFACQPAPERALSTFGAKRPSATARTAQAIATARTWSAAQRPSLPIGPTVSGCSSIGVEARMGVSTTVTRSYR